MDLDSPYGNEPVRHPAFKINKEQPFNGEPPPSLLKQSFITPNELHFIRNRLPVPDVDVRDKKIIENNYEDFFGTLSSQREKVYHSIQIFHNIV